MKSIANDILAEVKNHSDFSHKNKIRIETLNSIITNPNTSLKDKKSAQTLLDYSNRT